MNIENLSIKEIKNLMQTSCTTELIEAIKSDSRKGVTNLIKIYEKAQKEIERVRQLYSYERACKDKGYTLIAGVDEVGRGPLAGPVVIASVILPEEFFIEKINDSKKLSEATREKIYNIILENAISINRAIIDEKTIDRINIYQAAMNGMYEAIYGLDVKPDAVLIDAMPLDSLDIYHEAIIKGDSKSASIAAASIVAKVERDRMMNEYDKIYPQYGFAKNKGYGTGEHLEALRKYGPCPIHRKSFEPIKSMVME